MQEIAKRKESLPAKPEELRKWILIGKVKLKAQIAAIKALSKLDDDIAAHAAALSDTQDMAEILLYAEADLGEKLEGLANPTSSRRGTRQLPDGIDKKQSHFAQILSRNKPVIAKVVAEAREKGEVPVRQHVLKAINVHVSHATGENEWYTPDEYIKAARKVMGSIDTDPATTEKVNKRIGAKTFYTIENTGLGRIWRGNIWMNPPYSQPDVTHFCDTFAHKFRSGEIKQGCVLINNVTETKFGQRLMGICSAICFPAGRVRFLDKDGGNPGGPLQGQMVIYCGQNTKSFIDEFSKFGICLCAAR